MRTTVRTTHETDAVHTMREYGGVSCRVYKYADCDSTNEEAAKLVESAELPVIVVSQHQRKGRGRRSKHWMGDAGKNVYLSIALPRPRWTEHYTDYQYAACLAVVQSLSEYIPRELLSLKYPNDVLVRHNGINKKIAGILVEAEFRAQHLMSCVCGIGINVNQRNIGETVEQAAVSLAQVVHRETNIDALAEEVVQAFFHCLQQTPDSIFDKWVSTLELSSTMLRIVDTNEIVRVTDIQRDGSIRVTNQQSGEVRTLDQNHSFRMLKHD